MRPILNNEAHVWFIKWDDYSQKVNSSSLSYDEIVQFERYLNRDRALAYLVAHSILRLLIGKIIGVSPEAVEYCYSAYKKPFLKNNENLYFNLSYGNEWIVIGITHSTPHFGVDIEAIKPQTYLHKVAETHFSVSEQRAFREVSSSQKLITFYRGWTRKEAFIKAVGTGLSHPIQSFSVTLDENPRLLTYPNWHLYELQPDKTHIGAIATDCHIEPIIHNFDWHLL